MERALFVIKFFQRGKDFIGICCLYPDKKELVIFVIHMIQH